MTFSRNAAVVAWLVLSVLSPVALGLSNEDKSITLPPGAVLLEVPQWVPVPISREMYWWWRKYGPWDYKVQSSQFIPFTSYNFGASGAAAKVPQQTLLTLAQAAAPLPSDIGLLDQPRLADEFKASETELESLRKMADADAGLIRIAVDFTWQKDNSHWPRNDTGLTPERWSEYRALFAKLHVQEGLVRSADFPGAIFFVIKAKGLCVAGSSSGFVYSERSLAPVSETPVSALDAEARSHAGAGKVYAFHQLKPNWYAFYELDW